MTFLVFGFAMKSTAMLKALDFSGITDLPTVLLRIKPVGMFFIVTSTKLVLLARLAVVVEEPEGEESSAPRPFQRLETVTAI